MKYLVPSDGSLPADEAFNFCIKKFLRRGDIVLVVIVVENSEADPINPQLKQNRVQFARKLAEKYEEIFARLRLEGYLQYGTSRANVIEATSVPEILCKAAEDEDADMIIAGRRRLSDVQREAIGSVTDYLVRHAPCPVLVTRAIPNDLHI